MNKIIGEKVNLRKASKEDMKLKVKWYNDPNINKTLFLEDKLDIDKTLKWFEEHINDTTRHDFIIETKERVAIGLAGFVHFNNVHETAESYCAIGEKEFWGKGLSTEAHLILFHWGFQQLKLHKIWADIKGENTAILKVSEKLGFKIEGKLREEKLINGKREDVVKIGLLREEFYQTFPHLKTIEPVTQ